MELSEFRQQVLPLKNRLFRLAVGIVSDPAEAEDVVQEVFIKIWGMRHDMARVNNLQAWCFKLVRNLSIDKLRSKHRRTDELDERYDQVDPDPSPHQQAASNDALEHIRRLMERLPEKQRAVMLLRDVDGLTYQEIADTLDISLGQVKINLFRARQNLKKQLLKSKIFD